MNELEKALEVTQQIVQATPHMVSTINTISEAFREMVNAAPALAQSASTLDMTETPTTAGAIWRKRHGGAGQSKPALNKAVEYLLDSHEYSPMQPVPNALPIAQAFRQDPTTSFLGDAKEAAHHILTASQTFLEAMRLVREKTVAEETAGMTPFSRAKRLFAGGRMLSDEQIRERNPMLRDAPFLNDVQRVEESEKAEQDDRNKRRAAMQPRNSILRDLGIATGVVPHDPNAQGVQGTQALMARFGALLGNPVVRAAGGLMTLAVATKRLHDSMETATEQQIAMFGSRAKYNPMVASALVGREWTLAGLEFKTAQETSRSAASLIEARNEANIAWQPVMAKVENLVNDIYALYNRISAKLAHAFKFDEKTMKVTGSEPDNSDVWRKIMNEPTPEAPKPEPTAPAYLIGQEFLMSFAEGRPFNIKNTESQPRNKMPNEK